VDNQRLAERPGNVPREQLPVLQRIRCTHRPCLQGRGHAPAPTGNRQRRNNGVARAHARPRRITEERTLDDYKALEDDVARLTTRLDLSQSALACERNRVERRNEMIRELKGEIERLKRPQSNMSTTMSST
jgi:hypothetical protein